MGRLLISVVGFGQLLSLWRESCQNAPKKAYRRGRSTPRKNMARILEDLRIRGASVCIKIETVSYKNSTKEIKTGKVKLHSMRICYEERPEWTAHLFLLIDAMKFWDLDNSIQHCFLRIKYVDNLLSCTMISCITSLSGFIY
jgi:hypothetical protein